MACLRSGKAPCESHLIRGSSAIAHSWLDPQQRRIEPSFAREASADADEPGSCGARSDTRTPTRARSKSSRGFDHRAGRASWVEICGVRSIAPHHEAPQLGDLAIDQPGERPRALLTGHNLGADPAVPIVARAAITAADAVFDLDQITRLEIRLNAAPCRHRRLPSRAGDGRSVSCQLRVRWEDCCGGRPELRASLSRI